MKCLDDKNHGKKLRKLRLEMDYPQKLMAEKLGLKTQQIYSKLERGEKHFSDNIIYSICHLFNMTYSEFTGEMAPVSKERTELEYMKKIIELKKEVIDYQKIIRILYHKLLLEKEIELIKIQINQVRKYDAQHQTSK